MKFFKWLLFGLIGGAVGAAIWAGVTIGTHYEIGWIAWGVGFLSGVAVRYAAGEDEGVGPGVVAVVAAIAAIAAGKFIGVVVVLDRAVAEELADMPAVDDSTVKVYLADGVVEEARAENRSLEWPEGQTVETATEEAHYPKDVWAEAEARFDQLTPADRDKIKAELHATRDANIAAFKDEARMAGFRESFGPMDALFFLLAIATAYKLGSGASSSG